MDALTRRVAARYHRQVLTAFLSVKWFKAQKDALKNILNREFEMRKTQLFDYLTLSTLFYLFL